jgi:hypothetical protein
MLNLVEQKEIQEIKTLQNEILRILMQLKVQDEELISIERAEELTNMEYQKLRTMFLNGEITGKRFGKKIRLSKSELLKCESISDSRK